MTALVAQLADGGTAIVQQVGDDPDSWIGPGLGGFLAVFFVALATVLLIRSMTKHLRNVRYSTPPGEQTGEPREEPVATGPGPAPSEDVAPTGADDVTSRG